jgi:plasmid stabilization system protein ParE
MPKRLIFSARALRQLASIEAYIASFDFPRNAENYVAQIRERCQKIALAPEQGTPRDHRSPGIRTTGFKRRVAIVFRVEGESVTILSIWYAGKRPA